MASENHTSTRDADNESRLAKGIAGVTAVTGLLSAAASQFKAVREAVQSLSVALPAWALSVLGVVLLALSAVIAWTTRKQSRLNPGETLKLNRDDPQMLVGREEDVELLLDKCVQQRLVFLKGDSGCGKSALIRSGLEPAARRRGRLYPLILDYEGHDWEATPIQALRNKMAAAFTKEGSQIKPNELDDLPTALQLLEEVAGRTPLIVFDQIDDYQQNHRDAFVTPRRSTLSSDQLARANRFWSIIAVALKKAEVHVLMATRSDMAGWLESFRFVEPQDHLLFSVETVAMRQLLLSVASRIRNPGLGWEQLVDRIIVDLDVDGRILPQRLRIMMRGLERLPALTPGEYSKAGGALGVDALYVEGAVRDAVIRSGLPSRTVRALLNELVDPANPRKTRRRSIGELEATASALSPGTAPESVGRAIRQLEDSEVIRNVTDASNPDVIAVQLDHDYLAVVIHAVVRRSDRWNTLLRERCAAFESAGRNLWRRWRHLLGVREFWPLIWAKLARHDDAGDFGGRLSFIAISSLTTLVPLTAITLVVLAGLQLYLADDYARRIGNLSVAIQGGEINAPSADFIDMSRALRDSPTLLREEMLRHVLQNKILAEHALVVMPYLIRTLAGTSNEERLRLIEIARETPPDPSQPVATFARETALQSLDAQSNTQLPVIIEAARNVKDEDQNGVAPITAEVVQRVATGVPVESLLEALRPTCSVPNNNTAVKNFLMREVSAGLVAAGKFDQAFLHKNNLHCFSYVVDIVAVDSSLKGLVRADNDSLRQYRPEPSVLARRKWFDQVKVILGESKIRRLIQDPQNRDWLAGSPIAEFSATRGAHDEEGMRYIFYSASNSTAADYRFALTYLLLNDASRDRVRDAFHRALLAGNCSYARSLWSSYGKGELVRFINAIVTDSSKKSLESIWSCVYQADLQAVAQDVLSLGWTVSLNGHEVVEAMLDVLPSSTAKSEAVRQEIDYRFAEIRTSFVQEKQESESPVMQRSPDDTNATTSERHSDISPANQRRQSLMALIWAHPALLQGLSEIERADLWKYFLQDMQHKDSQFSLLDAECVARVLGRTLDEPSQRHLADQFYESLSDGLLTPHDAGTATYNSGFDPTLDSNYTTADIQHAVSSLSPAVRASLAEKVVRDICRAERHELIPLMISILTAAAGDRWDSEPWLLTRLQMLNLAITVGTPSDQLLGYSPDNLERESFWKKLEEFRKVHGLKQITLDHVWGNCPPPLPSPL